MSDLRLIKIQSDGEIEFTAAYMHQTISGREAAIQRYCICLLTTAGTMLDAPAWGGSGYKLYLAKRKKLLSDTEQQVAEVISATQSSLDRTEPQNDDYRIVGSNLIDVVRDLDRGYTVVVRLKYQNATDDEIRIPGDRIVAF